MEENGTRKRKRGGRYAAIQWVDAALRRRPVYIALVVLLIAGAALLIGPSLRSSASLVEGLKVGSPAPEKIKATRNFAYLPSEEVLQRRREQAAEKILPVFDHQVDRGPIILSRINRAFDAMRQVVPEGVENKPVNRRDRFAKLLQVDVPPEVFEPFDKSGFSSDLLASFVLLVGSTMEQLVISHRSLLEPFKEQPIVVRQVIGGRPSDRGEEKLQSFARIKDLQQIKDQIRHQANVHASKLPARLRQALVQLVESLVVANVNLRFNQEETNQRKEKARAGIRAEPRTYVQGEVIVRDGTPVTKEHLRTIATMESTYRGVSRVHITLFGIALLVAILLWVTHRYGTHHFRRLRLAPIDLLTMGLLALTVLALIRAGMVIGGTPAPGEFRVYPFVLPVAAGAMLVRMLIGPESAALFAVLIGAFGGLLLEQGGGLSLAVYYLVTSLVGAAGTANVQSRATLLRAGLAAGAVGAAVVLCVGLFGGNVLASTMLYGMLGALGGGVLAAFVALALLPALEWLFGYTTDITLLELANLNHPLLRDLMLRAPGTYHHSMVVGNLSETACEAIGANSLLAHVACNFHDVGKMKNAPYFAENFKEAENPHNRLKPSMSALIIRSHVKDTIEMLRDHGIPELVIDTATQHHGRTLIEFFFHKALEKKDDDEDVNEENYRYPGPKPQSREAGVIMLADAVEAAARSLAEPTEDRLRAVVQRVINTKFADGQLDHCDLTLRDLHLIAKSFLQILRGMYHQRPTYPWQREEARRAEEKKRRSDDKTQRKDKTRDDAGKGEARANDQRKQEPRKPEPRKPESGKRTANGGDGQPESSGEGDKPVESGGSEKDPAESGPDIKRLGLN